MRGSRELLTRLYRQIILASASPIALADCAVLRESMPWSNLAETRHSCSDGGQSIRNHYI